MSFNDFESSPQLGTPVELYKFTVGPTVYRYTSSEYWYAGPDTVDEATRYLPLAISRSEIADTQTLDDTALKVSMPRSAPFVQVYAGNPPSVVVLLNVYQVHWEDIDYETVSIWAGRVLAPDWRENGVVEFSCESVLASLKALGPRRFYQKACPHVLFGTACGVSKAAYEVAVPVGGFYVIDPAFLVVASLASYVNNYFAGGYISYTNSTTGVQELRSVRSSAAGTLSLSYAPNGIVGVTDLKVYPGCDHTSSACRDKFDNLRRYGGQLYIPTINPFNGAILY